MNSPLAVMHSAGNRLHPVSDSQSLGLRVLDGGDCKLSTSARDVCCGSGAAVVRPGESVSLSPVSRPPATSNQSSLPCQYLAIDYNAPLVDLPGRSVGVPNNWLRYCPGERSNQRLQARKKLLWSAKPSR